MAKRRRRWFLKEWRDKRGLSQDALAAKAGYTQGMISQWEKGHADYTEANLENLSGALGITVYQLLFQDPRVEDDPMAIYESLPEYEQSQAIEMLKSLQRIAGKRA